MILTFLTEACSGDFDEVIRNETYLLTGKAETLSKRWFKTRLQAGSPVEVEMQIPATPSQREQSRAGRYDGNMALVASLSDKTNYQQWLIEESMRCQLLN